MNKEDKIEFIRRKCVEANPEIAYLTAGCRVITTIEQHPPSTYGKGIAVDTLIRKTSEWIDDGRCDTCLQEKKTPVEAWHMVNDRVGVHTVLSTGIGEIIGRPIRLADILLAYSEIDRERDYIEIMRRWDKWHDDLTQQSDETIEFLFTLLQ